jgi:hypothetical protein
MNQNRVDPTASPVRLSENVDIQRQTPKTEFGDRVKAGLDATGSAVAQGAAVVAPFVPGGAIVSAAVSSVGTMSNTQSSGQALSAGVSGGLGGGGAVSSQYASTGVVNVGGGVGGINTTVGGAGTAVGGVTVPGTVPGGGGIGQLQLGGSSSSTVGSFNQEMVQAQADNSQLIQVQIQMNHENQVFSTISNVLKVRNDTVKNTIQNVH